MLVNQHCIRFIKCTVLQCLIALADVFYCKHNQVKISLKIYQCCKMFCLNSLALQFLKQIDLVLSIFIVHFTGKKSNKNNSESFFFLMQAQLYFKSSKNCPYTRFASKATLLKMFRLVFRECIFNVTVFCCTVLADFLTCFSFLYSK